MWGWLVKNQWNCRGERNLLKINDIISYCLRMLEEIIMGILFSNLAKHPWILGTAFSLFVDHSQLKSRLEGKENRWPIVHKHINIFLYNTDDGDIQQNKVTMIVLPLLDTGKQDGEVRTSLRFPFSLSPPPYLVKCWSHVSYRKC